ncbi:uncharacterized protein M437DRAFT_37342 [Aureobasidium melanogenum CBS 110374]|uniref:F-box domain-containing protein n=1 Tax=Aureobasidium melanogenum (strain CBS 110374) TaxID=1043003 RepID=A0A074W3Z0_AURM1|nr:uncharacterized protein M437DRAFT_37342 [Aureobasidium melanogenum CBS 110374]KEQ67865.1 hypothetical protein M437DRAFT_37342 [Aureobasidium melanogenum CBS 110374]
MDRHENTFPQEIWVEVMRYCSQESLVTLSRVSPLFCTEARKLLLRTVRSKYPTSQEDNHMGVIHRPYAFYDLLSKYQVDWRRMIRSIELHWLSEYVGKDGENALFGREKPVEDHLIFRTAMLLCECHHLNDFHLSVRFLKVATAMLKNASPPLTSLDFSLPHRYSWEDTFRVFSLPTLDTLVIRNLLSPDQPAFRYPSAIPDALHEQHAVSNVRDLRLLDCGPLTQQISPLFQWPKKLERLIYAPARSKCEPYWRTILRRTGDISDAVDLSLEVLAPLRSTLQELHFDLGLDRHWILPFRTGELFRPFTKLSHLTAPVELIMQSSGLSRSRLDKPFYTNLPPSLEDLELKFTSYISWHSRAAHSGLSADACLESDPAHQLFDEISTLAVQKEGSFPAFRKLTLTGDGEKPFLVKCCHVDYALDDLENRGVHVVQRDWYRQSTETWS